MTVISVEEISKAYRERRTRKREPMDCTHEEVCVVLQDISFTVDSGSLTCFVGPSGCGKSTLFRIIAGFETPNQGRVLIDHRPVTGPTAKHIFIFQEDGLFPWMTARDNVVIGAKGIKDSRKRDHQVMEYLDLVGLKGFEDHYPHELSGGMRRRAEVARALITNPEILYMDEPFAALDFVTRLQMREEIINVHAMFSSTILFITHDIDEALQLGDRMIILDERPATVKANIELPFPHPRDLTTDGLAGLRKEIYFLMGLHPAL